MKTSLMQMAATAMLFASLALAQAPSARVRVVHASPDAPAVDIYVDGAVALDNIAYKGATDYVELPAGQRIFQVFVSGTQTKVAELNATLTPGTTLTVIAAGFAAKSPALRLVVLSDNIPNDMSGAYVRVVHGAPTAPGVDVYVGAPYQTLARRDPALTGVPFGAASGYVPLRANTGYMARVTPAGTKTIAIESGRLSFPMGTAWTVIAVDATDGGTPFGFLALQDR
jgi:hypothetical protein